MALLQCAWLVRDHMFLHRRSQRRKSDSPHLALLFSQQKDLLPLTNLSKHLVLRVLGDIGTILLSSTIQTLKNLVRKHYKPPKIW